MLTNLSQTVSRLRGRWPLAAGAFAIAGLTVASLDMTTATAKTPGSTYCFYGTCHRVKTLDEMHSLVGTQASMLASFYDSCKVDRYNPCGLTSSGERFHPDRTDNAASPIYPDGTTLLAWSAETTEAAVLRVNNAGPYWGRRTLDVSRAAAEALGFKHKGVGALEVRVLSVPEPYEATYKREREYDPVPGHIGQFDTIEEAVRGAVTVMAVQTAVTVVQMSFANTVPVRLRAPVPDAAEPASGEDMLVAAASEFDERAPARKASVKRSVASAKPVLHAVMAAHAKPAKARASSRTASTETSGKKTKRVAVASRKAAPKPAKVAVRAANPERARVAAVKPPAIRVASVEETTAAGFRGPVHTLQGKLRTASAAGAPRKMPGKTAKRPAGSERTAAVSPKRSSKKVTALPTKALKVSEVGAPVSPGRGPLTGDRLRLPAHDLDGERALRPRAIPARPVIA